IDPEFKALIPPLSPEELATLEANIAADGCRDPLVAWVQPPAEPEYCECDCPDFKWDGAYVNADVEEEYRDEPGAWVCSACGEREIDFDAVLLDGHNRLGICGRLGLDYRVSPMAFANRDAALLWIIDNQIGRRNLSDLARVRLAEIKRPIVERLARERQKCGQGGVLLVENLPQASDDAGSKTRDKLASQAGVSGRTYDKLAHVIERGAPALQEAVETGLVSADCGAKIADLEEEEQLEIVSLADKKEIVAEVKKRAHVANNSGENEWYTPAGYIAAARATMGGIDTDPASCELANRTVGASEFYGKDDNGLERKWAGRVWMNPPYAQPLIAQFSEAVSAKFIAGEITEACVLVNNATDTAWFHTLLEHCSAVCFIRGRVKFLDPSGKPGAPLQGQAVIYMGEHASEFGKHFSEFGMVLYQ
ncbi:MAG: hypothetical protein RLZZ524_2527, partial [Pseudomonadota bacterium]